MPFPILALAQLGIGLIQSANASSERKRKAAAAERLINSQKPYQTSQYALDMAADTRSRLNAVSPGVLAAMGQLDQSVANQTANAQRNAGSGAQALAVTAAARSQANSMLPALAAQQDAASRGNRQNYYNALGNLQNEGARTFESQRDIYSDQINLTLGQMQAASAAQSQGNQNAVMGAGSLLNSFGGAGGAGGIMGGMARTRKPDNLSPLAMSGYRQMTIPAAQTSVSPGWYSL